MVGVAVVVLRVYDPFNNISVKWGQSCVYNINLYSISFMATVHRYL